MSSKSVVIGITHGDINGIGYEILMKALSDEHLLEICCPIVYGSAKVASYYRKLFRKENEFNFNIIKDTSQANTKKPNLLNISEQEIKINRGEITPIAGEMAHLALKMASKDLMDKKIDAIVTCPVNKSNIRLSKFNYPGQTEFFTELTNTTDSLMLMVSEVLKIGTATTHCPFSQVSGMLTKELIYNKIKILNQSLKTDFNCTNPRIAVLALNPHAGDDQLFGSEEQEVILPAIEKAFSEKIYAFGPFSADGFFGSGEFAKFDGVLAMSHDQAMIPFKLLSYGQGVNYTAGLPIVRTSPSHGPAMDIAGKDIASADSLKNAIYLAHDIYKNREKNKAE